MSEPEKHSPAEGKYASKEDTGLMTDIVGKLWGFCNTLRHDGIDYGDYIEQLTYLLFLKMIEEKGLEIPPESS
jgi:type I restriction-modification system DNA methylase subunit